MCCSTVGASRGGAAPEECELAGVPLGLCHYEVAPLEFSMCRFTPYQSHDADEVLEDSRCYTLVTGKSFVSCSRFFSIKFFSDISEDDFFFFSKNFFDTV